MRVFPKGATSYAVLLVILFAIATLAVWHTLGFLESRVASDEFAIVAVLIWSLTLGFMFIAGAFGLWAVQFAAQQESRRRIGRIVDAMDYLHDGLLAVDRRQHIRGSNPAARALAAGTLEEGLPLKDAFPFLQDRDITELLQQDEPHELSARQTVAGTARALRFRSQPSEGMTLLLISDVTVMEAQRLRNRQAARLQLIGQIARGVAHDFNNLLCTISGHASLLSRLPVDSPGTRSSIEAISRGVEKGSALAGHLLELVKPMASVSFTNMGRDYLENAVNSLRDGLHEAWHVDAEIKELPAIAMTGIQIEQVVTNLGLLIADSARLPGTLYVRAAPPGAAFPFDVGEPFAGAIIISTVEPALVIASKEGDVGTDTETGVIFSVVQSMLEEAGGALHAMAAADGSPVYRMALPFASALNRQESLDLPADLGPYIADWTVLLGKPQSDRNELDSLFQLLNVNVIMAENIVAVLAKADTAPRLDAIIIDKRLIIQEVSALLKAILKLCPGTGVVVLCDDPASESQEAAADIVFAASDAPPNQLILSIIEARSLAMKRRNR